MRRLALIAALIVLVGAVGAGWLLSGRAETASRYRLARVEAGPIVSAVTATGTVNPVLTVQVGSQLSGQIQELHADFNTQVKAGNVIARLDRDQIEARLKQAEADLLTAKASLAQQKAQATKARADISNFAAQTRRAEATLLEADREFKRQRDLQARGVAAVANVERAETTFASARAGLAAARAQDEAATANLQVIEAQVQAAEAGVAQREAGVRLVQVDLDRSIIRSPIDGVVVLRNVDVGQTVAASLQSPVLFTIAQDFKVMEVYANVDEADIGRVREGQPVTFTVSSYPNDNFEGTVSQIRLSPQVIQNVVTYTVVVSADNSQLKLLPGMTANIRVVTDRHDNVLKVPNAALRYRPIGVAVPSSAAGAASAPASGAGPAQGPGALDAFVKRFTDTIEFSAEQKTQLDAIVADWRRQIGAAQQQRGDASPEERRNRAQAMRVQMMRRINDILTDEQKPKFAALRQELQQQRTGGTAANGVGPLRPLWVAGSDGRPQALMVRTGIGDGAYTEVSGEGVRAGLEVIIGGSAPATPGAPQLRF
jgi:HlyD family secretion protein